MERTFFICALDPIVQMDLVGALHAHFPDCKAVVLNAAHEISQHLDQAVTSCCLFVSSRLWSQDAGALFHDIAARGGQIVTIGGIKVAGVPATILETPFSTQMMLEAVTKAKTRAC